MEPTTKEIVEALRFEASIYVGSSTSIVCGAAADHLEEMEAELVALKEQQRWIPVTEPPPKQEHVWIYYKNWAGKWVCNVGWWSGDIWYHHDETPGPYGWGIAHEVPTHWMPLPEPPMEE